MIHPLEGGCVRHARAQAIKEVVAWQLCQGHEEEEEDFQGADGGFVEDEPRRCFLSLKSHQCGFPYFSCSLFELDAIVP
jgi:hypothetical protein